MRLTEKEIGKKIKCYHNGDVILRAVFLRLIWVENGDYMQTWENDGSWEVVEEKHECKSFTCFKAHKPAEPKKSIAGEINDIIQKSSDPMMNITPEYQKMRSAYQANLRLNALISVLDEKFKEIDQ